MEEEYIDSIRSTLPELPYEREKRYLATFGLPNDAAVILVNEKALADYFEEGLKACTNAKNLCNWIIVEFAGRYKESGKTIWTSGIPASHIGQLVTLIDKGIITGKIAKKVADIMVENPGKEPESIVQEDKDLQPMGDPHELEAIIDRVLADNPESIQDFLKGKERALAFLVGQVMKATQGKAPPPLVNKMLKEKMGKP